MPSQKTQKRKFHEVVSTMLTVVSARVNPDSTSEVLQVATLLSILQGSHMSAEHAHSLARFHYMLPEHFRNAGQNDLANEAAETLKDLEERQDEPKKPIELVT